MKTLVDQGPGLKTVADKPNPTLRDSTDAVVRITKTTIHGIDLLPFVRAPEGNGCAERLIQTLKENLLWVRTFDTIEHLRQALFDFRRRYNEEWIIQRHGYKTPAQIRADQIKLPAIAA